MWDSLPLCKVCFRHASLTLSKAQVSSPPCMLSIPATYGSILSVDVLISVVFIGWYFVTNRLPVSCPLSCAGIGVKYASLSLREEFNTMFQILTNLSASARSIKIPVLLKLSMGTHWFSFIEPNLSMICHSVALIVPQCTKQDPLKHWVSLVWKNINGPLRTAFSMPPLTYTSRDIYYQWILLKPFLLNYLKLSSHPNHSQIIKCFDNKIKVISHLWNNQGCKFPSSHPEHSKTNN